MLIEVFGLAGAARRWRGRGVRATAVRILQALFLRLHAWRLLPTFLLPRRMARRMDARLIFVDRRLAWDPRGFWSVDPMPDAAQLDRFYQNAYWTDRGGKHEGVERRDLDHFLLLTGLIPDLARGDDRLFVNFGAGHGGISHLMYLHGWKVINVEPSGMEIDYGSPRWSCVRDIGDVPGGVHLLYGSHSLEHVADIDSFESIVKSRVRPGGWVFWEVPNAGVDGNGGSDGIILAPHTHYFTLGYFDQLGGYQVLLSSGFDATRFPAKEAEPARTQGQVIRFLGRLDAQGPGPSPT